MPSPQTLFPEMYAAFNRRDISACLATMSDHIDWPKASEGGRVLGKDAIRDYWTRQWAEFNPTVTPTRITERPPGHIELEVHQIVRTLTGDLLFDGTVLHIYTLEDGLIQRMDLEDEPKDAFQHAHAG